MATHYLPAFTVAGSEGTQRSACGHLIYPSAHSTEPTCPACRAYLEGESPTYRSVDGVDCCVTCLRPAIGITPDEQLYMAAKRVLQYFDAKERGAYFPPNEDLHVARQLGQALAIVEEAARRDELVSRR